MLRTKRNGKNKKLLLLIYNFFSRNQLMKIDNHILSLSMEFEKNNIIINEWEGEKAKKRNKSKGRSKQGQSKRRLRKSKSGGGEEADNEESGFEDEMAEERHSKRAAGGKHGKKYRDDDEFDADYEESEEGS